MNDMGIIDFHIAINWNAIYDLYIGLPWQLKPTLAAKAYPGS